VSEFTFDAEDEVATDRLGDALAETIPDGTTIALCGTLGAGKTRLVQAIAAASGIDRRQVLSPTFVLVQEYSGSRTIYHFDAYRIRDDDEFLELGPDEYFESDGVTLIEWADRVADCLPREYVEITIEVTGAAARQFRVQAIGESLDSAIQACEARLRVR